MKKKNLIHDENALSEALGFMLIMGILVSASTIYLSTQLPEWTKDYESRHADDVADDFSEQDSLIDGIVLVAQRGGETAAGGTTPIKMSPDKVPIFGMSPPGSSLNSLPDDESFVITPYVGTSPLPTTAYNFSWVESTTEDFENGTATRVNVDVNFDTIRLSRLAMHGELILNNTNTTLSGEYQYNKVEITNNSNIYLVPGYYLKLYANTIFIDSTSTIIADYRGYDGGDGGKLGSGTGYGKLGYNGSGGSGAGYGGKGGNGGLGGCALPGDNKTGGDSYGDNTSLSFDFGSGGGGGGYGEGGQGVPHQGAVGGDGGNGGGAVLLDAPQITIAGTISAKGSLGMPGAKANKASGGGGAGSGGTITIIGYAINLSSATLSAKGGAGGDGGNIDAASHYGGGGGGGGAGGRIKIFYDNASLYDNTTLSYSVAGGIGGAGGKKGGEGGNPGDPGGSGLDSVFYENETTYISTVPHYSTGYYVSRVFDTGNTTTCYGNMTWDASTTEYTPIVMKVRTSISPVMDDYNATMWVNCDAVANGQDISGLNSAFDWHQYVQYRAELSTYDTSMTPVLYEVCINYSSSNPAGGSPVVEESSGIIKFQSSYLYYPNQEIAYEHGAVIKSQDKGEKRTGFMLHSPPINITNGSDGIPTIRISMIDLIGSDRSYSGSTTTSVENSYKKDSYKSFSSKFDNLTLNLTTEYPYIWGDWFNETLEESNLTAYHDYLHANVTDGTVTVEFYGHGHGVQLYLEKTAVKVEI